MSETAPLDFKDAVEWRSWLAANHRDAVEVWVIHYKAKSKVKGLRYVEALEEALSYGWIDGKLKSIDDEKFALRYTPRKVNSVWSKRNKEKAEELIRIGKMTEAGLESVEAAKKNGNWETAYSDREALEVPRDLARALNAKASATTNFANFAVSTRNMYIRWIGLAKTQAKRQERITEIIERAEHNLKLDASFPDKLSTV